MFQEEDYISILKEELVPALGCTEPIAIAYASAKARQVLGAFPDGIEIYCSGNIIKNVKSVLVPNSGGMRGIGAAAVLGVVGGNPDRELEVLQEIRPEHIQKTKELLAHDFFSSRLQENVANLYIIASVWSGLHSASVKIINRHTLISEIRKDGEIIYQTQQERKDESIKKKEMSVAGILEFAGQVELDKVRDILERQITLNTAIARNGLEKKYGAQVGRTLLETYGDNVKVRARAFAAAGSDARMGGCSLPVVINSGSGNQGMAVSLPVIEYAREWNISADVLYRALLVSNLTAIHLKYYIGSLSAFCGAVMAACGAGAGITYMAGGDYEQISHTIVNTLANIGGVVCDGAKASCAAKISSAVDAAILAHELSMENRFFPPGEGIIQGDVESTIKSMGYVGRIGMKTTDIEILNIMMDQVVFQGEVSE